MSEKKNNKYNKAVLKLVSERQRLAQGDTMRDWWYNGSLFRKITAVVYEVMFYLTVVVNLIVISGYNMRIERFASSVGKAEYRLMLSNSLKSFLIGTVLLASAYVVRKVALHLKPCEVTKRKKVFWAYFILTVLSVAVLALAAYNALILGNADSVYATSVKSTVSSMTVIKLVALHFVPLGLQLLAAVLYLVVNSRCDGEKLAMYKKITENLYAEFTKQNSSYTQNDWENHLNSYAAEQMK